MKLVTFKCENTVTCGILTENGIIDIPASLDRPDAPRSVKQILTQGTPCLNELYVLADTATKFLPLDKVTLLAPIPKPEKLLALAGNYRKHIIEAGRKLELADSPRTTTIPRPFLMPSSTVTGPDTTVPWPDFSEQVDHEIELAIVIGKTCRCVSPEQALEYVGGYTIANDISARSVTFKVGRTERPWDEFYDWLNGKWSDGFLPLGPCLVTADEFGDPQNAELELKVNGETRQKSNTKEMIFTVADTVSFISHIMTLTPGDVIATGTPEGVAMGTGKWLKPGDHMECTIQKIGTLKNKIGPKPKHMYKPLTK
jgi:2-keto-4-pentenoate hydratase/2-oxohepta-3-ene-1,7-dioic acid hydratase in catechol pathway